MSWFNYIVPVILFVCMGIAIFTGLKLMESKYDLKIAAYEQCPVICEAKGYKGFVDYSYISNDLVCECSNNRVQIKGDSE